MDLRTVDMGGIIRDVVCCDRAGRLLDEFVGPQRSLPRSANVQDADFIAGDREKSAIHQATASAEW